MAMQRLLDSQERTGSLFGFTRGSVQVQDGWDLTQPAIDADDLEGDRRRPGLFQRTPLPGSRASLAAARPAE